MSAKYQSTTIATQQYHNCLTLSDEDKNRLHEAVRCIHYPFPTWDYEAFVTKSLQAVCHGLSTHIVTKIRSMKVDSLAAGVLKICNLPIDDPLPLTPPSARRSDIQKQTFAAEVVLTGIAALLGEPIGYEAEKEGALVHDLIPVVNTDKPLSNEGSKVDFGLHVEDAIFTVREHFIILFGQRQDRLKQAVTPVAVVRDILPHLPESIIDELFKEQFIIRKPYILDRANVEAYSTPVSILSGPMENPTVRVTLYEGGTHATTPAGNAALSLFREVANKVAIKYKIQPGEMVVINNFQALHGRSAFKAYGDGLDRYLMRSYVMDSLWAVRELQSLSKRILNR